MTLTSEALEFSRRVPVRGLPDNGKECRFEATEEERAALARRLGIAGIERLEAQFTVSPEDGGVRARGRFEAVVVQQCVVTLEPVTNRIEGQIEQSFAPATGIPADRREVEIDAMAEEPPEPLVQGAAELGELVAENLALALDPYPRAPGAQADLPHELAEGDVTPFAKLRALKNSDTES